LYQREIRNTFLQQAVSLFWKKVSGRVLFTFGEFLFHSLACDSHPQISLKPPHLTGQINFHLSKSADAVIGSPVLIVLTLAPELFLRLLQIDQFVSSTYHFHSRKKRLERRSAHYTAVSKFAIKLRHKVEIEFA